MVSRVPASLDIYQEYDHLDRIPDVVEIPIDNGRGYHISCYLPRSHADLRREGIDVEIYQRQNIFSEVQHQIQPFGCIGSILTH